VTAVRVLAVMGSGETAPTMVRVHRTIFDRLGPGPAEAVLLDTPFGFQANADELTARALAFFAESVGRDVEVASFRRADAVDALELERLRLQLRDARLVFSGPGSPSYALRQWVGSPVPGVLADKLRPGGPGGCVSFASAAALTLGVRTVPVYEIYKVGEDPRWLTGLDLTAVTGLSMAVIPHFDNNEGGTHDTRFCYLGEARLRSLEEQLPDGAFVLGVDEHTAAVFDLHADRLTVLGRGGVTVRAGGRSAVLPSGTEVSVGGLGQLAEGVRRGAGAPRAADAPGGRGGASVAAVDGQVPGPRPDATGAAPAASPLLETVGRLEARFARALARRDGPGAVREALALEGELHAWRADTLQSDELDRARAVLRGMVVGLGEAAGAGLADPHELVRPWVEALLDLRGAARRSGRWSDADAIRDRLLALGVEVRDGPAGTVWELHPAGG